jgi:hypothetical protein
MPEASTLAKRSAARKNCLSPLAHLDIFLLSLWARSEASGSQKNEKTLMPNKKLAVQAILPSASHGALDSVERQRGC